MYPYLQHAVPPGWSIAGSMVGTGPALPHDVDQALALGRTAGAQFQCIGRASCGVQTATLSWEVQTGHAVPPQGGSGNFLLAGCFAGTSRSLVHDIRSHLNPACLIFE